MRNNQRVSFSRIDGKIGVRHLPDALKKIYELNKDVVDQIILTEEHMNNQNIHYPQSEISLDPSQIGIKFLVTADGTDVENGTALLDAYAEAKTLNPSVSNIITIIVAPGRFDFQSTNLVLDTPYINIVSLTGNMDVEIVDSTGNENNGRPSLTADNVYVHGVDAGTKRWTVSKDLDNSVLVKCRSMADHAFGDSSGTTTSTFIDCEANGFAFGNAANLMAGDFGVPGGTYIRCSADRLTWTELTGTCIDCYANRDSFEPDTGSVFNCRSTQDNSFTNNRDGNIVNCFIEDTGEVVNAMQTGFRLLDLFTLRHRSDDPNSFAHQRFRRRPRFGTASVEEGMIVARTSYHGYIGNPTNEWRIGAIIEAIVDGEVTDTEVPIGIKIKTGSNEGNLQDTIVIGSDGTVTFPSTGKQLSDDNYDEVHVNKKLFAARRLRR